MPALTPGLPSGTADPSGGVVEGPAALPPGGEVAVASLPSGGGVALLVSIGEPTSGLPVLVPVGDVSIGAVFVAAASGF